MYLRGSENALDVVIVGGYFAKSGSGWRHTVSQSFPYLKYPSPLDLLCAVPRWEPGEKERLCRGGGGGGGGAGEGGSAPATAKKWAVLTKVGTGVKQRDVQWLNETLGPYFKPVDKTGAV